MFINKGLSKTGGFSLVELAVTMGLMGLVSLLTMKIMENQNASQLSIEAAAEINTTTSLIAQTINDPQKCASMFSGLNITTPALLNNGLRYNITNPPPTKTVQLLQTRANGKVYQNFFILNGSHLRLINEAASGTARLEITYSVQPANSSQKMNLLDQNNARTIIRNIPFNISTAGNIVTSCGPIISSGLARAKENACLKLRSLGATWSGGVCTFRAQKCGWGQVVVGFNASGNIVCRAATSQVNVDDIFDTGHVINCKLGTPQYWRLVPAIDGRLRLNCHL